MLGTGDAGGIGQSRHLLTALTSPLLFPILKMEALFWAPIPFFLALYSVYQLLISTLNHSLISHKTGPIFQNQNQRSQDNETENQELLEVSLRLASAFLFPWLWAFWGKPFLAWSILVTSFEPPLETGGALAFPFSFVSGPEESRALLQHWQPNL